MENQENQEKKHKRRVRYSGTHPRNYKEKHKELNPEKYADTISKVIQKGGTPAGMHISICVQAVSYTHLVLRLQRWQMEGQRQPGRRAQPLRHRPHRQRSCRQNQ